MTIIVMSNSLRKTSSRKINHIRFRASYTANTPSHPRGVRRAQRYGHGSTQRRHLQGCLSRQGMLYRSEKAHRLEAGVDGKRDHRPCWKANISGGCWTDNRHSFGFSKHQDRGFQRCRIKAAFGCPKDPFAIREVWLHRPDQRVEVSFSVHGTTLRYVATRTVRHHHSPISVSFSMATASSVAVKEST